MTISQLKAELEKGPQEAAVYTQQIHELQSNLNNLQQQSQVTHAHHARTSYSCCSYSGRISAGTNVSTFTSVALQQCVGFTFSHSIITQSQQLL